MKKTFSILLFIYLSMQFAYSQNHSVKDSILDLLDERHGELNPIEGIWIFGKQEDILVGDSVPYHKMSHLKKELFIYKKGRIGFEIYEIDEEENKLIPFPAYFERTAIKGRYTVEHSFNDYGVKSRTLFDLIDNSKLIYTIDVPDAYYEDMQEFNSKGYLELSYFGFRKYPFEKVSDTRNTESWKASGTGFFIDKRGYIATNYHVIEESDTITATLKKEGKTFKYRLEVVATDKKHDLAILKIKANSDPVPFNVIPFKVSESEPHIGTQVFALGFPFTSIMGTEIKFTEGRISSRNGLGGDISNFQNSTPLQPGNSGGPLFDFDGNLVGINSSHLKPEYADNVSYAIKPIWLFHLAQKLPEKPTLRYKNNMGNRNFKQKIELLTQYVVLIKVK